MEKLDFIIKSGEKNMEKSLEYLKMVFVRIRSGKSNPILLEGIKIECNGKMIPLKKIANVSSPDSMTLKIQPWDRSMLSFIEKSINAHNSPINNGENILIRLPMITEDGRKNLVKKTKAELENIKVRIRNIRKEVHKNLKKLEGISKDNMKSAEERIQKITNEYIKKVEDLYTIKEKEIMSMP
jgi:ribosome recycling factor